MSAFLDPPQVSGIGFLDFENGISIRVGHAVADDVDIHMYALISAYADYAHDPHINVPLCQPAFRFSNYNQVKVFYFSRGIFFLGRRMV